MSRPRTGGPVIRWLPASVAALTIAVLTTGAAAASPTQPPPSFVRDALCVHSGWHFTTIRPHPSRPPDYVLWHHGYWKSWDVPDGIAGGSGEAPWNLVNSYGGGMQFTLGTWNRAARLSHGAVPYASSDWSIAQEPAAVQIYAAWLIVTQDGGSWSEWPNTGRACGLPEF